MLPLPVSIELATADSIQLLPTITGVAHSYFQQGYEPVPQVPLHRLLPREHHKAPIRRCWLPWSVSKLVKQYRHRWHNLREPSGLLPNLPLRILQEMETCFLLTRRRCQLLSSLQRRKQPLPIMHSSGPSTIHFITTKPSTSTIHFITI